MSGHLPIIVASIVWRLVLRARRGCLVPTLQWDSIA